MMRLPEIRFVITAAAVLAATLVTAAGARAADYPTREIEFIVAFPAGGPADTSARVLAPLMSSGDRFFCRDFFAFDEEYYAAIVA